MIPVRIIRSEAELASVATDSLVCPAYDPASVYQAGSDGTFAEPGVDYSESLPAASLWHWATQGYETIVLDVDAEMWVIWDAAAKVKRPDRGKDSPDWMTCVPGRDPLRVSHMTKEEGVAALEAGLQDPQVPAEDDRRLNYSLWRRTKDRIDYYLAGSVKPGTPAGTHPW